MTGQKDPEYDGPIPSGRADDREQKRGVRVRIEEVAALLRDARRLTTTGGSDSERAAFLQRKARLIRRLDAPNDACRGGESR